MNRALIALLFSCCLIKLIDSSAWDFSVDLSSYSLNRSLLITECQADTRRQVADAFGAALIKDAIEEPSSPDQDRIQCIEDPTMDLSLFMRLNRDSDDDSITGSADRQRFEIKSPLEKQGGPAAKQGSTFAYAWWFTLNEDIKPPGTIGQFYHVFQIKSDTGETEPLVTFMLHPRGEFRLRLVERQGAAATYYPLGSISTVAGAWTEAVVIIHYDMDPTVGYVEVTLKNSKGINAYYKVFCQTFWDNAGHYRAKWGLYRSTSTVYNLIDTIKFQNIQIRHK